MKKIITVILLIVMSISVCACGTSKKNQERDPNAGKLLLSEELVAVMEAGFNDEVGGYSIGLCPNGERIKSNANSTAQMMDIDIRFDSYEITSYEKVDDYNYSADITLFGEITMLGTDVKVDVDAELYFSEADNEDGYAFRVYCSGLREKLRTLAG